MDPDSEKSESMRDRLESHQLHLEATIELLLKEVQCVASEADHFQKKNSALLVDIESKDADYRELERTATEVRVDRDHIWDDLKALQVALVRKDGENENLRADMRELMSANDELRAQLHKYLRSGLVLPSTADDTPTSNKEQASNDSVLERDKRVLWGEAPTQEHTNRRQVMSITSRAVSVLSPGTVFLQGVTTRIVPSPSPRIVR